MVPLKILKWQGLYNLKKISEKQANERVNECKGKWDGEQMNKHTNEQVNT